MSAASASKLSKSSAGASEHLRSICEFSLNQPPMRAKVDKQSYDELKPGVQRAMVLYDWFVELQANFTSFLSELAQAGGTPSPEHLQLLADAIDACVVLENQFGGWSACVNRFSWFKRTITQIRKEVSASDPDCERISKAIPKFQNFIGAHRLLALSRPSAVLRMLRALSSGRSHSSQRRRLCLRRSTSRRRRAAVATGVDACRKPLLTVEPFLPRHAQATLPSRLACT